MILRHTHGGQQLPSTGHSREQPPASAAPRANRKRCARIRDAPEAYCTLSSRSMVTRVVSPFGVARIIRTAESRDPAATDLPPECIGGAFARTSSAAGGAAVEVEAKCSSRTVRRRSATAPIPPALLVLRASSANVITFQEIFISLFRQR